MQALERRVYLLVDLLAGEAAIDVAHRKEKLGGEHVPFPRDAMQRLAHDFLRLAETVYVGGVEQRDAAIESPVYAGDRVLRLAPLENVSQEPNAISDTTSSLAPSFR